RRSDVEAFAAAALVLDVGVVELEPLVQALFREIELGPVEIAQALRVDDHLHAVALEGVNLRVHRVRILELVRHAGAAGGAHAQAQAHALATLRDEARDVRRRAFGQGDHQAAFTCAGWSMPCSLRWSSIAAWIASSARIEQWIFTGGSASSSAIWVFLILPASSSVLPFTHSVTRDDDAIAEPQP